MRRRAIVSDQHDSYTRGDGFQTSRWDDGSTFTTGFVVSQFGIVGVSWWNGTNQATCHRHSAKRTHWLRLRFVVDGTNHTRTVERDTLTQRGVVILARRFAAEAWS